MPEETKELTIKQNAAPVSRAVFSDLLSSPGVKASLAQVAPRYLTPERIVKMALIATSRQPTLLQCTQASLLKAIMTSAEMGLDCSGTLGRGYLVPFWNKKVQPPQREAVFIPGYLGLIDLARRSNEIKSIFAEVVYKDDFFLLERGLNENLSHKPNLDIERKDQDITGAYLVAHFVNGGHHIEHMVRAEIEAVRKKAPAGEGNFWRDFYPAMCKKTVVRRAFKFLPSSVEVQQLVALADSDFDHNTQGRVEPIRGMLSLEDLTPGDPATHPAVDAPPIDVTPESKPEPTMSCLEVFNVFCDEMEMGEGNSENLAKEIKKKFGKPVNLLPDELASELDGWLRKRGGK